MAVYIKGRVIYLLEPTSGVGRLDILPKLVLILGINLLMPRDLCLQLLSHFSRCISLIRHLRIPSRGRLSLWVSRVMVLEIDLQGDLVAEDLCIHPFLNRLAMGRPECLL